jgi:hypothetical protein
VSALLFAIAWMTDTNQLCIDLLLNSFSHGRLYFSLLERDKLASLIPILTAHSAIVAGCRGESVVTRERCL